MKLCVYAICKNERKHIDTWLERVKEADCVVVLDTGSTDGTWEILQQSGIKCYQKMIKPWRFDVARNEALKLVPDDCEICLPLDIDQIVLKGFSGVIKASWQQDTSILQIPQYFKPTNTSGMWYAHSRVNCYWKYPVHEQIKSTSGKTTSTIATIIIHDFEINKPSHETYLELAELGQKENPIDPYCLMVRHKIKNLLDSERGSN